MKRYHAEAQAQGNATTYHQRKEITSEITIPLFACTLFGLGITLALAVIQWGILNIPPKAAFQFAGGIGLLATSLAVAWRFFKAIVWIAEETTHHDLDRDGYVGEPEPEPRFITIRNRQAARESREEQIRQQFVDFIRGCEIDTSMRRWMPHLSRARYLMFRTMLMKAGHAAWSNDDKRQGWELNSPAEDIIASLN